MSTKTKLIIWGVVILLALAGGFYYYLRKTGLIGAEAVIGCQGSGKISQFLGPPGSNLTTYNLFGHEVSVNQKIVPYLDHLQKDVNDAKTGYNFTDVTTYND